MKKKSIILVLSVFLILLFFLNSQKPSVLSSFSELFQKEQTTFLAVGDVMLGRYCNVQMINKKDWQYPFSKIADFTRSADIVFGNLEAPFVENCPTRSDGMIFCARPEAIEGLKFAGFDILSLANNHILNYGPKGLEQTKRLLSSSNILYSPLTSFNPSLSSSNLSSNQDNKITTYQANDISFGFLSFDLTNWFTFYNDRDEKSTFLNQLNRAAKTADILIVSLHWGNEYQKNPTQSQKELARQIIDAGAKVIIGHHPHVTQPVEEYNGGLIFYSLGNFVFDQPWSEETKKGAIAKIIFEGKNIKSYQLIPVRIENYCQPRLFQ